MATDPSKYIPRPLDTSKIQLTGELARLVDFFAENTHDIWARDRIAEGWKWGTARNDPAKEHPGLIHYKDLPETEKKYSRDASIETIKTLISLGYRKEAATAEQVVDGGDLDEKVQAVIKALKNPLIHISQIRQLWEDRLPIVWFRSVQIYRRAVDAALKLGEAFLAFDISAEGLTAFKNDLRLIQLQALALARTGATGRANALLEQLRLGGHQDEETLGLLARTHKDFWTLAFDPEEKRRHLKISYELYLDGYRRNRGYYSGINAATMGMIYGDKETAQEAAREVCEICLGTLEYISPDSDERYWLEATLAEAALVLGDLQMSEEYYRRGGDNAAISPVVLSRTRAQARLLLEHTKGEPNLLDHCFHLPRIGVFSGHMFDAPGRANARFPHNLEDKVRAEIAEKLAHLNVEIGYSSLACGSDLIFAEALLERGGEVNIVLPFQKEDFRRASVDIYPGTNWGDRFDHILKEAASVIVLNERGNADDSAAYDFCNRALSGLALLKSQFLGMDVVPLVVWDGQAGDGRGGTQSFVDFWQGKLKAQVEVLALDKYADFIAANPLPALPPTTAAPAAKAARNNVAQEIKAMLFADIVGFTKLSEDQVPVFVEKFLGRVAELMDAMKNPPIHKNTWGDAVCCVFDHVADAGVFATNLRDLVRGTDWSASGLPNGLSIRIALHAGPVFACFDPVLKKRTFNGSHVNRTARIEPIAEEGQVYASEAFAALSAAEGVQEFTCDYVGTRQLAKKYGAIPVFLVRPTVQSAVKR